MNELTDTLLMLDCGQLWASLDNVVCKMYTGGIQCFTKFCMTLDKI